MKFLWDVSGSLLGKEHNLRAIAQYDLKTYIFYYMGQTKALFVFSLFQSLSYSFQNINFDMFKMAVPQFSLTLS